MVYKYISFRIKIYYWKWSSFLFNVMFIHFTIYYAKINRIITSIAIMFKFMTPTGSESPTSHLLVSSSVLESLSVIHLFSCIDLMISESILFSSNSCLLSFYSSFIFSGRSFMILVSLLVSDKA